jgi:hypothetical protein
MSEETYTYQGGRKLWLSQTTTHFVSRAKQVKLLENGFVPVELVSPHSWTVQTRPDTLIDDIRRARALSGAFPAYTVEATGTRFLVTDRIFLRFRRAECATDEAIHEFVPRYGLTVRRRLSARDFLFAVDHNLDVVDIVRRLTEDEANVVEMVDHDRNVSPHNETVAANTHVRLQWHLSAEPVNDLVARCALLDCHGAWQKGGLGDTEVVISIIDSGCDLTDPNFSHDRKFAAWAVLIDGQIHSDSDWKVGKQMMQPAQLHGTVCATLAAGSAKPYGGQGVAPACRLLPVKCQELDTGQTLSDSLFIDVIKFLRDKVDIVSNSWCLGPNGYWSFAVVDALEEAAKNGGRSGNGVVWIWSAGNQNCPIDFESPLGIPTKVTRGRYGFRVVEESARLFTNSFAGRAGVLHVGAISSLGQRSHYSNYGRGLDLVAPSSNEHLYRRVDVSGIAVLAPLHEHGLYDFGGTSAAAPLVAGVAALARSANPDLTAREIVSLLKRTADKDLDMTGYPACSRAGDFPDDHWDVSPVAPFDDGSFAGNDPDGSWSPWFGFGKVNARAAVEEALRRHQPTDASG